MSKKVPLVKRQNGDKQFSRPRGKEFESFRSYQSKSNEFRYIQCSDRSSLRPESGRSQKRSSLLRALFSCTGRSQWRPHSQRILEHENQQRLLEVENRQQQKIEEMEKVLQNLTIKVNLLYEHMPLAGTQKSESFTVSEENIKMLHNKLDRLLNQRSHDDNPDLNPSETKPMLVDTGREQACTCKKPSNNNCQRRIKRRTDDSNVKPFPKTPSVLLLSQTPNHTGPGVEDHFYYPSQDNKEDNEAKLTISQPDERCCAVQNKNFANCSISNLADTFEHNVRSNSYQNCTIYHCSNHCLQCSIRITSNPAMEGTYHTYPHPHRKEGQDNEDDRPGPSTLPR